MSALQPRDYNRLDPYLQQITRSRISLKNDEIKQSNETLTEILQNSMIPAMERADPLFKCLFKRLMYSGSYYEKLKISAPNEFDLNMELEIPSTSIEVQSTGYNGFVLVKVKQFDQNKLKRCFRDYAEGEHRLKRWLDDFGHLKRQCVLNWVQGVVDKALTTVSIPGILIRRSTSGPAITLNIQVASRQMAFSIDLVPVFIFGASHWPKPPVRQPVIPVNVTWCVVPKAPGYVPQDTHWRISFYDQEKRIMNGYNAMKHIIKLIKLMRDANKWDCLSSYYIKTVFLWEMEQRDRHFWQQGIGTLYVHMLKRLVYHLKDAKSIPFYWDKRHSLISGLNQQAVANIGNRLHIIVQQIERRLPSEPHLVKTYFPGLVPSSLAPVPQTLPEQPRAQPRQALEQRGGMGAWGAVGLAAGIGILAAGVTALMAGRRQNN